MGRPPSGEPDVFLDVPGVHVGRLEIDVERLDAQLALRAQVANLVNLVAGVNVSVDKVKIDLEDVSASALLEVRLQNTYNILDRTLTTIDEHPEIVQRVLDTADVALEEVGDIGTEAVKPGGAVRELTSGVGGTLGGLGDTLKNVSGRVNPKRLKGAAGPGANKRKLITGPVARHMLGAKATAGLAAGGVASLLGGALYRAERRPRVLGVPIGRKNGAERVVEQIGKLGGSGNDVKKAVTAPVRRLS